MTQPPLPWLAPPSEDRGVAWRQQRAQKEQEQNRVHGKKPAHLDRSADHYSHGNNLEGQA